MGNLVTWDVEKAEVIINILAVIFTASIPATLPKLQKAKTETGKVKYYPL